MPHFFISYAKKDTRELALQLNEALSALPNVTAWVDKSLKAGRSWELQIQTEIDRCDYMIVLYSPDINRHKHGEEESYILTEISYAKYTAHKHIIPIMAQKTEAPLSLTTAHYIDFTLSGFHLDDLIAAICDETGILVGAEFIPPAAPRIETSRGSIFLFPEEEGVSVAKPISLSLMPAPFAWIDIPGKGYSIAKYPITNAQFAMFIEAGGYNNRQWWTDVGWDFRKQENWQEPRYWTDAKWNGAEQPVLGVSWYESVAFCLWLSEAAGEKIILPTEGQWQYAAQGDDGRDYPWGNDWICKRCNNSVGSCNSSVTTPVRQYEGKGDSPFRVVDMAGNVGEWCLTDFFNKTNDSNDDAKYRVLRGGMWLGRNSVEFRCDNRHAHFADNGDYGSGFRVSRS